MKLQHETPQILVRKWTVQQEAFRTLSIHDGGAILQSIYQKHKANK